MLKLKAIMQVLTSKTEVGILLHSSGLNDYIKYSTVISSESGPVRFIRNTAGIVNE